MSEAGKMSKPHRTRDSLTSKHLQEALTLTTEHIDAALAAVSTTTRHIGVAVVSAGNAQSSYQDSGTRENESSK